MTVEYASRALVGVLTPQANTTVEPEYAILCPRDTAWINARMLSPHKTIEERLVDYWSKAPQFARQFANAPVGSLSFACTGTSYLVGKQTEDDVLAEVTKQSGGLPAMSAATAVCHALGVLGARRIGLVSPYEGALDAACTPYWESRGFEIGAKTNATGATHEFHPIYSLALGFGPARARRHGGRHARRDRHAGHGHADACAHRAHAVQGPGARSCPACSASCGSACCSPRVRARTRRASSTG